MPDSLFAAVKKVAEVGALPWPQVQKVYRALQGESAPYLPRSAGRHIWYAHPNFIARLLIGLAGEAAGYDPRSVVEYFHDGSIHGAAPSETEHALLTEQLARYLSFPDASRGLVDVEFRPDDGLFRIVHESESADYLPSNPFAKARAPDVTRLMVTRVRLDGRLFERLAQTVEWRHSSSPPFRGATTEDQGIESLADQSTDNQ